MLERPLSNYWTSPLSASKKWDNYALKWPDLLFIFPIACKVKRNHEPSMAFQLRSNKQNVTQIFFVFCCLFNIKHIV